jgi:hypothetical protein
MSWFVSHRTLDLGGKCPPAATASETEWILQSLPLPPSRIKPQTSIRSQSLYWGYERGYCRKCVWRRELDSAPDMVQCRNPGHLLMILRVTRNSSDAGQLRGREWMKHERRAEREWENKQVRDLDAYVWGVWGSEVNICKDDKWVRECLWEWMSEEVT